MCIEPTVIVHIHGHTYKSAGMHKALVTLHGRLSIDLNVSSESPGVEDGGAPDCVCGVDGNFMRCSKHVHHSDG